MNYTYIIPEATRTQWKKLAQATGMPYSTVVGQHVYDIQGLVEALDQELTQTTKTQSSTPANTTTFEETSRKVKELTAKLEHTRQQLAAYQLEQQKAETETGTDGNKS